MVQLMIIADDFTGALDTGVQFAKNGANVRVVTKEWEGYHELDSSTQVIVVDAKSRHLPSEVAYKTVHGIVKGAVEHKIPCIYKKTDSALRGNIGSELQGLKDATGKDLLYFIPAFPQMNRITREGIHYVDGKPVSESVFGKDPFTPVKYSYVPDIIKEQTDIDVIMLRSSDELDYLKSNQEGIVVFDASEYKDVLEIAEKLKSLNKLGITAGCAGFGEALNQVLGLEGEVRAKKSLDSGILVICGSVNPITKEQLKVAEMGGYMRISLSMEQLLEDGYLESEEGEKWLEQLYVLCKDNKHCIVDTSGVEISSSIGEERELIAKRLGEITNRMWEKGLRKTLLITGGDTVVGFMNEMGVKEMEPIGELEVGIVQSLFKKDGVHAQIITKSGGFGDENLLLRLAGLSS